MLRVDSQNPRAVELGNWLEGRLSPSDLPDGICLVLGGDGAMLRAAHDLGATHTLLGLNCGTVGFLLNDVPDRERVLDQVLARRYQILSLPRLRMDARQDGGAIVSDLALNDVYVERMQAMSCQLQVRIDGIQVMDRLVCDGIIVATSIGSTGYSYSAGGPACHPLIRSMHITPICPRNPRLPSILVPMTSRVEVTPLDTSRRPVRGVVDWLGYPDLAHLAVEDAHADVRLAFLEGHDFTATMFRKVLL